MTDDTNGRVYDDFVHTGPGTLAGRYLRMFWQPVFRGQDLAPGQAVPVQIMGERFTLYRGESGRPHLMDFRCAHRGTQLSTGWVEGDCIRCLYHGWKYDASGQCVEQPGEDEAFSRKVRIRAYPTEEYIGLIFVFLGEGEPPPMRRYPEFEHEPVLEIYRPDVWPCNYFNRIDNYCDMGHVLFTHRESTQRRGRPLPLGARQLQARETDYGVETTAAYPGEAPSLAHVDMPNTNHLGPNAPGTRPGDRLFFRVPVNDESCVSYCVERTYLTGDAAAEYREQRRQADQESSATSRDVGDAVLAGKQRLRDIEVRTNQSGTGYTDIFWVEDYTTQVGQGPIADRSTEHLGRIDVGVILLRKIWQRELRALAEGRPLKQWASSAGLGDRAVTAFP
jgi:5,5'-dehydrodivanillate O-demethylase oxygenase subunit